VQERPRRAPLAVADDLGPAVDLDSLRGGRAAPTSDTPVAPAASAAPTRLPPRDSDNGPRPSGFGERAPPSAAAPDTGVSAAPASAAAAAARRALDSIDLGTTSITGNQELPKVLYIVPWKRSDLGELVGRPVNSLLDEVLTPVDPEVFERQLQYYESLFGTRAEE
jgi:hypothetical protein